MSSTRLSTPKSVNAMTLSSPSPWTQIRSIAMPPARSHSAAVSAASAGRLDFGEHAAYTSEHSRRELQRRHSQACGDRGRVRPIAWGRSGHLCGLPSTVTAATSISADAFARGPSGRPPASAIGTRSDAQSRPIFYSLPRRRCYARHGVDRPASRHAGLRSCFHVLLSAAWKRGHAQANDRHSSRVFAMRPRGFTRTTRNG